MQNPRAVLWDMDGTLIDSGPHHWLAWQEVLTAEGLPITYPQFLSSFGQRNDSILRSWYGDAISEDVIRRIGSSKEARYRQFVSAEGAAALPGTIEWVERLHREGWLQAIASAAPGLNVEAVLRAMGLADRFQAIVSAEDVKLGKPDPEVFLTAASRLGVHPEACIVVEDARAGVEAARRAGMRSIAVGSRAEALGADVAVVSLADLPAGAFSTLLENSQ
ncbi:MAG TPA: HAD family phosphatase [Bryobacteraceae bacterium]|nr:HAD family phosphatase [Bryobacteraceae bacterium]